MNKSARIGSALVVVGSSIAVAPAMALELGDITVRSTLGQPLRASVAYALGPNEAISQSCVTLQPASRSAIPAGDIGTVTVTDGVIHIFGAAPVDEPITTIRLNVRCRYTARLTRDYSVMIDPPRFALAAVREPVPARIARTPLRSAPPVARPATVAHPSTVSHEPISMASRYVVQPGDSLSAIAQRVSGGSDGLWPTANAIFAANPDAFIDNDRNRIKAGSRIVIPAFDGAASTAVAEPTSDSPVVERLEAPVFSTVYHPGTSAARPPIDGPAPELLDELPAPDLMMPEKVLRPGDLIIDSPAAMQNRQPDSPRRRSESASAPTSIIQQPVRQRSEGSSWWWWLGGGGLVAALGLALTGRSLRNRVAPTPLSPAEERRHEPMMDDAPVEAIGDVDIDISDDSPTAENVALDADLGIGTGLSETADVDVASDFAFASTTELDLELTEDMAKEPDTPSTDIIPPMHAEESGILKNELLPDDDDYDMSVVLDATKMPDPADVTERDLEAIAVDDGDEALIADDYSVSQEVDYKILEQDYADEMTATQALNAEIQKAAEDLALSLEDADITLNDSRSATIASVHELDVTAEMPANDDHSLADDDETGVNEQLEIADDESAAKLPRKGSNIG